MLTVNFSRPYIKPVSDDICVRLVLIATITNGADKTRNFRRLIVQLAVAAACWTPDSLLF